MIFYEIPFRSSLYEKTAASYNIYTVYSKLAFLKILTSLILLIPFLLIGVKEPLLVIQSDNVDRCL
jgi:hypothetical protein